MRLRRYNLEYIWQSLCVFSIQFQEKEVYIQVDSVRAREKIKWNFQRIPHQNENTLFTFNFLEFHQQRRLLSLSKLLHKKMKLFSQLIALTLIVQPSSLSLLKFFSVYLCSQHNTPTPHHQYSGGLSWQ